MTCNNHPTLMISHSYNLAYVLLYKETRTKGNKMSYFEIETIELAHIRPQDCPPEVWAVSRKAERCEPLSEAELELWLGYLLNKYLEQGGKNENDGTASG